MPNTLPKFGEEANVDDAIVQNTSNLKQTGFLPNTLIESAQINTYFKMFVNALNGLSEVIASHTTDSVSATSSIDIWKNYITTGLTKIVESTKVNNAVNADKLTNKRKISLSGDASGSVSFDGSTDTTLEADVKKAAALDSHDVGSVTHPVYFNSDGKPQATQMFGSSITANLTKIKDGEYSLPKLYKTNTFWAYVTIFEGDNVNTRYGLASGITEFTNGHPIFPINGTIALPVTSSSVRISAILTNMKINLSSNASIIVTDLHNDGHTEYRKSNAPLQMYIYTIYEE